MEDHGLKYRQAVIVLILMIITAALFSCLIGRFNIDFKDIYAICIGDKRIETIDLKRHILFDIRIPRILLSMIVGSSLAMAGTGLQAVLKNPLASPDVLGTASASGFGSALGIIVFGKTVAGVFGLSFLAGLGSILLVFALCKIKNDVSVLSIILSGIIVSSLFISFISILKFTADPNDTLPAITFWLMGSFTSSSYRNIQFIFIPFVLGTFVLFLLRWKLNIASLGDDEAKTSGINPFRLRKTIIIASTILISSSVTVSGIIGWVGLVIPHFTRKIIGANHGYVIPLSGLSGAFFMLICDDLARSVSAAEVPIGIITALLGAPLFALLWIFKKQGMNEE